MPQIITKPVTNETYHVFNRGVDKRDIFLDKADYVRFYQTLDLFNSVEPIVNYNQAKHSHAEKKLVDIQAYSLLPNHYHLLVKQLVDDGLGEFIRRVGSGYTTYFNNKNLRSGALFQGVFKRVHVETDEQYLYLFAYINKNHFVHNISLEREICHSSSLHYQNIKRSKLISNKEHNYSFENNRELAIDIYKKRKSVTESKVFQE